MEDGSFKSSMEKLTMFSLHSSSLEVFKFQTIFSNTKRDGESYEKQVFALRLLEVMS